MEKFAVMVLLSAVPCVVLADPVGPGTNGVHCRIAVREAMTLQAQTFYSNQQALYDRLGPKALWEYVRLQEALLARAENSPFVERLADFVCAKSQEAAFDVLKARNVPPIPEEPLFREPRRNPEPNPNW
jgi:hypothetical protein